ncbi:hypothetical protein UlMin_045699 [Ulmus minor]
MSTTAQPPPAPPQSPAEGILIPGLPNNIALNCLARVPRFHHPVLSAVSKPIRSLLASPAFFNRRSLLKCSESLLYVKLMRISSCGVEETFSLSTLYHKPNQNQEIEKNLVLVPSPPTPVPLECFDCVAIGPKIYVSGANIAGFWVFDCRFHSWEIGPDMLTARTHGDMCVVDDKIYVMGGISPSASPFGEVFDPITGQWEIICGPDELGYECCVSVGSKIYVVYEQGGLVFETKTKIACLVDGIWYYFTESGKIRGFDESSGVSKKLKGLEKEEFSRRPLPSMANVGGRLVLVQQRNGFGEDAEIWCGEIEVTKIGNGDLFGVVRRLNKVARGFPERFRVRNCLSVSL